MYVCPIFIDIRMTRIKFNFILMLLLCGIYTLSAQDTAVRLRLKAGDKASHGAFISTSIEGEHNFNQLFSIRGGAMYSSIGRTALDVRPALFHDLNWGRIQAEALLQYSRQASINNTAAGLGLGLDIRWVYAKAGYYYRSISSNSDQITEPLNYFYEFGVRFLEKNERWDLDFILTNSELFELERQYQMTALLEGCWNASKNLGINFGVGYKPSGTFHMSSDYYQLFGTLGLCYRW